MSIIDRFMNQIEEFEPNDVLRRVGLQTCPSTASRILSAAGLVGTGMVIGAGLGLLFAPCSGEETRAAIAKRFGDLTDRAKSKTQQLGSAAKKELSGNATQARS